MSAMKSLNSIFSSGSMRRNNDLVFYLHNEKPENSLELNLLQEHSSIKLCTINLVKHLYESCKEKPYSFDPKIFADDR